jgi:hypothetical protein
VHSYLPSSPERQAAISINTSHYTLAVPRHPRHMPEQPRQQVPLIGLI